MMRFCSYLGIVLMWCLWVGCGGTDGLIDRFCTVNCKKLEECQQLGGLTVDTCLSTCRANGQQSTGPNRGCTPSSVAVDACVAAIEASSCPFQTPAACQNLCGGQNPATDGGVRDQGGGGKDHGGVDHSSDTSGGGCGAVQGSCVQKKDGKTQCQEYSGQLSVVLTGLKDTCIKSESTTWFDGTPCRTSAPGMNYGCERNSPAGCVTSYAALDARAKAAAEQGCSLGGGRLANP